MAKIETLAAKGKRPMNSKKAISQKQLERRVEEGSFHFNQVFSLRSPFQGKIR